MSVAYERLIQHLEDHNVQFEAKPERQMILADFHCDAGWFRIAGHVDAEDDLFEVIGIAPFRVPEGGRPAVAETIARANYGLRVGRFELDVDGGEVRYQAYYILSDGVLEGPVIQRLIGVALAALDRCTPAILSVIYANEPPADAIRRAEADLARLERRP